jgi:hypothetical protein
MEEIITIGISDQHDQKQTDTHAQSQSKDVDE